jgi:hypothetical protein
MEDFFFVLGVGGGGEGHDTSLPMRIVCGGGGGSRASFAKKNNLSTILHVGLAPRGLKKKTKILPDPPPPRRRRRV